MVMVGFSSWQEGDFKLVSQAFGFPPQFLCVLVADGMRQVVAYCVRVAPSANRNQFWRLGS